MTETTTDGVIVGAVGGEAAVQAAEVVAVLLASRLTTPVAAASLTDPGSIKDAAAQLLQAVPRVALAPCMIGPELTSGTLEAIAALTSTESAPPLGSHSAVGQLVAIRYGAALADPNVASMVAEGKGESPTAPAPPCPQRCGAPSGRRIRQRRRARGGSRQRRGIPGVRHEGRRRGGAADVRPARWQDRPVARPAPSTRRPGTTPPPGPQV